MRFRDVERQNQSPILRDLVRGFGGYGSGWFDINGADTFTLNYVANSGTAQAGSASTITLAAGASAVDGAYAGMSVQITAGTASGDDTKSISSYIGSTKVATIAGAWSVAPDSTSAYKIVNRGY
jgi:hypothetical protein